MSAKDNILHAMKWTVKDVFGHKMEVSNAVDGCVIFHPHKDAVQITYEDLEKLIANLRKPNTDYIRKNSEEKHYGRFPWGSTESKGLDFIKDVENKVNAFVEAGLVDRDNAASLAKDMLLNPDNYDENGSPIAKNGEWKTETINFYEPLHGIKYEYKNACLDDYIRDEREKRLATKSEDPDIKDLETAAQEFADNFHGKFNKEDMTLTVPKDQITIDECATWVERFNLPYKYVSTTFTDYVIQL